jgi:Phage tail lysozyme
VDQSPQCLGTDGMPTIIDALVITLGLDASGFQKGHRDAEASMAKTKDAALKQSKELEERNKQFADSFNLVKRQALELFAAIAGASGIKSFIADVTTATAALGRLSENINVSPQELGAWGLAIERIGGNASEAASDFQTLSQQLFDLRQNGKNIPESLQKMGAEARVPIDYSHGLPAYLHSLATAASELTRLHGGDRSDSFNFLKQAGIGPGMAQVLIDNGSALDKYITSLKNLAPTDAQIKKFEALQKAFYTLQETLTALGRALVADFAEPMEKATQALTDFLAANQKTASGEVFSWLQTMKDDAQAVADVLNKIVDAENWLASHGIGAAAGALADKFGPKAAGSGEATPIPWGSIFKWFGDNWGVKSAKADTLDGLAPGRGNSGPHPAPGLFIQGQQVSRGNPMPVTIVATGESASGGGFLSWLFGGGSPTSQGGGAASGGGGGLWDGVKKAFGLGGGSPPSGVRARAIGGTPTGNEAALAKQGYDYWRGEGLTHDQALAVLGNQRGENGLGNLAVGDHGTAFGQGQWHNDRRQEILRNTGIDVASAGFLDQQKAMRWEFENGSMGGHVWNALKASRGDEGVGILVRGFERPANPGPDIATRKGYAARYGRILQNGSTPADAPKISPKGGPWVKSGDREYATDANGMIVESMSRPIAAATNRILPHRPVSHTPLSTMSALHPVTTASTSNSMRVDQIHVNAPNATNATGIADRISDALRTSTFGITANFGQA